MVKHFVLHREQWIPRPVEEVFAYFADAQHAAVVAIPNPHADAGRDASRDPHRIPHLLAQLPESLPGLGGIRRRCTIRQAIPHACEFTRVHTPRWTSYLWISFL